MKQIVEVTWLDAQDHNDTWVEIKDAEAFTDDECRVVSVGFLIRKTDKYVTIGSDYIIDDSYGCVRKIPINMVLEIKEL